MRIGWGLIVGLALVAGLTADRARCARGDESPTAIDGMLRRELLQMKDRDQALRAEFRTDAGAEFVARLKELDAAHAVRMKAIVDRYGWPGKRLVGDDGAHAAWLLIQHATGDLELMKRCLKLMEQAAESGDASPLDVAYLTDRVLMLEGKPQRYGTQFHEDAQGRLQLYQVENAGELEARRRRVGLPSLAEYEKQLHRYTGKQSAKPAGEK